jgi:hypothetical protein
MQIKITLIEGSVTRRMSPSYEKHKKYEQIAQWLSV